MTSTDHPASRPARPPDHPPADRATGAMPRPWWRWVLTAAAFPPAGLLSSVVVGPVDSPAHAVAGGLLSGAVIGAGQWAVLGRRGVRATWIPATVAGLGVGLTAGAALVGYRTDLASLALMGAVSGLAVGAAQGAVLGGRRRAVVWAVATAALWATGWTVTTLAGIEVEEQFTVFGSSGAVVVALLQSLLVNALVPADPPTSVPGPSTTTPGSSQPSISKQVQP